MYFLQNSRSRDDLDMERALRPRLNGTPDVVRSTLCRTEDIAKYDAETIDYVIGTPEKILIPERYVPENSPELTPEEQDKRLRKAEAIRKMLSETGALTTAANGNFEFLTNNIFHHNIMTENFDVFHWEKFHVHSQKPFEVDF